MFQCQSIVSTVVTRKPLTLQLIDKGGQWPFFWKVQKHFCLQTWKVTISNFECVGTILSKKVKIKGTLLSFSCSLVHTHTHPCRHTHMHAHTHPCTHSRTTIRSLLSPKFFSLTDEQRGWYFYWKCFKIVSHFLVLVLSPNSFFEWNR